MDDVGPIFGTVAAPQFIPIGVKAAEVKDAVHYGEVRVVRVLSSGTGIHILYQNGPTFAAVALPKLLTMNAIVGHEEERAVVVDQILRCRRGHAGTNVLYHHRS